MRGSVCTPTLGWSPAASARLLPSFNERSWESADLCCLNLSCSLQTWTSALLQYSNLACDNQNHQVHCAVICLLVGPKLDVKFLNVVPGRLLSWTNAKLLPSIQIRPAADSIATIAAIHFIWAVCSHCQHTKQDLCQHTVAKQDLVAIARIK